MEQLDQIADPNYVAGLTERPLDDVREMRNHCQQLENALSYVRRLVQGRLDIVGGEFQRRRDGGEMGTLSDLVHRLPELLSDEGIVGGGIARAPQEMEAASAVSAAYEVRLDQVLSVNQLSETAEMTDNELAQLVEKLEDFEKEISQRRHDLHTRIDQLQAEITRRYRTGEASVDSLLT
ncbi:MAG: ABC transporter substrate-binding protein [Acidimicrobiales bacterium]|nr:ABC transporter substrate-binding protein [Acidimicrobiales bacterium]